MIPKARPKLVVNEPMLRRPTARQMSATLQSVMRRSGSGALEPAREEVLVRRLAKHAAELPTEVGGREVGHFRQGGHVERLPIAGIHQILCAQEVTRRMEGRMEGPQDSEYCFAT